MQIVDVVCKNVVKKYFYYGDVKSISIDKVGEKLLNVNCVVNSDTRFEYNITVTNECRNYYTLHLFTKNKEYYLIPAYEPGRYVYVDAMGAITMFNTTGYEFLLKIWPYYNKKQHIVNFIDSEYIRVRDLLLKLKTFLLINLRLKLFCRDIAIYISNRILFFLFFLFLFFCCKKGKNKIEKEKTEKKWRLKRKL